MNKKEFEAAYKRAKKKVYFKFIAVSALISAFMSAFIFFITFYGYDVPKSMLFSIALPVPVNLIKGLQS